MSVHNTTSLNKYIILIKLYYKIKRHVNKTLYQYKNTKINLLKKTT